jgi:hypothetical protein
MTSKKRRSRQSRRSRSRHGNTETHRLSLNEIAVWMDLVASVNPNVNPWHAKTDKKVQRLWKQSGPMSKREFIRKNRTKLDYLFLGPEDKSGRGPRLALHDD